MNEEIIFSKLPPYIIRNPSLRNFKDFTLSLNSTKSTNEVQKLVDNSIINQIIEHLYKEIFKKEDYNSATDNFIDVRNKSEDEIFYLLNYFIRKHKFCSTSFEIVKFIVQKSPLLTREYHISYDRLSNLFSTQGKIGETFIMLNQQREFFKRGMKINGIKYFDNLIILFDCVELSIQLDEPVRVQRSDIHFSNRHLNIRWDYLIKNLKFYYIIENEKSQFYQHFLALTRDNKIKGILE